MIYEQGVNTLHLFSIEINEDGGYFAVRNEPPRFCVEGKTILEVALKADKIFEWYKKLTQ